MAGPRSLRYWPVVERWLETVDLGTALSPMSRRVSLRDFVDGGGAAEQSCCPSLILDLLSYDPEKRLTAQAAMEEAERMEGDAWRGWRGRAGKEAAEIGRVV